MLILLLPITFISLFLALMGYHLRQRTPLADWRTAFLQTATFLAAYMVLFSEFLSLFNAITQFWVACFWFLAFIVVAFLGWQKGWYSESISFLRNIRLKPDWFDIFAGSILVIILGLLFFIAIKSPVNNNDALLYHMSRVMHWAQNHSFQHYATNYEHQLYNPILAETILLHGRLLSTGDQFANLLQWSSLIGCLVGISAISTLLGNKHLGHWISLAFAISTPIVVLQSTNPKNDIVTAFWLICVLYFTFLELREYPSTLDLITLAAAFGLGALTKGTFFAYAISPLLYLSWQFFKTYKLRQTLTNFLVIGLVVLVLNLGYWSRNMITFGTPLGSSQFIAGHTTGQFNPAGITAGWLLGIIQNYATPSQTFNTSVVNLVHSSLGRISLAGNNFDLVWAWNHEDYAGNPLQMGIIVITTIILLIQYKKNNRITNHFLFIMLGVYLSFVTIVFYSVFGIRFQIPVVLAYAPIIGTWEGIAKKKPAQELFIILLLLSTFPWVLFNRTRPLIAMRDSTDPYTIPCLAGCTAGSILNEPPEKTMFAVWGSLGNAYVEATNQVKQTGCKKIGLKLDSNDLEYAYWYLLGAPQNGMRLESIVTYPELERYLDPNFIPCAIICTTCGDQDSLFGLNRIGSFGNGRIKIFSGGTYTPLQP